jgi:cyclopropane fatty-acyl-phospholipid synthase-like methyltransferase
MENEKIGKPYFDAMYAASQDPWNFTASPYEQEKYQHTIEALAGKQFSKGIEIGCSIGVLTELLANHCQRLLGVDISEQPVAIARERLKNREGVKFEVLQVPQQYPDEQYDLVVVSEVAYYLSKEDLVLTKELIKDSLMEGGTLCLVHWRPQIEGCVFDGDEVNEYFLNDASFNQTYQFINDQYRIDVIKKQTPAAVDEPVSFFDI